MQKWGYFGIFWGSKINMGSLNSNFHERKGYTGLFYLFFYQRGILVSYFWDLLLAPSGNSHSPLKISKIPLPIYVPNTGVPNLGKNNSIYRMRALKK
jgi:hypothetical protein